MKYPTVWRYLFISCARVLNSVDKINFGKQTTLLVRDKSNFNHCSMFLGKCLVKMASGRSYKTLLMLIGNSSCYKYSLVIYDFIMAAESITSVSSRLPTIIMLFRTKLVDGTEVIQEIHAKPKTSLTSGPSPGMVAQNMDMNANRPGLEPPSQGTLNYSSDKSYKWSIIVTPSKSFIPRQNWHC